MRFTKMHLDICKWLKDSDIFKAYNQLKDNKKRTNNIPTKKNHLIQLGKMDRMIFFSGNIVCSFFYCPPAGYKL